MSIPKIVLLDRDNTINCASSDPTSSLYYILTPDNLILKPGVREAAMILKAHNVPVIICTKQRCVGKGLLTMDALHDIHWRLQWELGLVFTDVLVETELDNKAKLYDDVLAMYPDMNSRDIALFDDDERELVSADYKGITVYDGSNLFESVCKAFNIK